MGETGTTNPAFKAKGVTQDGGVQWQCQEPEPNLIQRIATRIYDKFYNLFPPGAPSKIRRRVHLPFEYFFYATMRWGLREGVVRFWRFRLAPHNWVEWAQRRHHEWKLVDRRPKLRNYNRTVYAVNRDGDLGVVECPRCNQIQSLYYQRKDAEIGNTPPGWFSCYSCDIIFKVYLEDGLRKIVDHREGVPPLPSIIVYDDTGIIHLGISADAPWWWHRAQIHRDFNPANGKDGHGHQPYLIEPAPPQRGIELGCCQNALPETESPQGSTE